jgi:hypothetical protein
MRIEDRVRQEKPVASYITIRARKLLALWHDVAYVASVRDVAVLKGKWRDEMSSRTTAQDEILEGRNTDLRYI